MRASFLVLTVPLVFASGCLESAWQDVVEHFTDTATTAATTSGSTSSEMTPTTTAGAGVQTVTSLPGGTTTGSDETTSSSSTASPPQDDEPMVKVEAKPAHLEEAGQMQLHISTDPDVVKVRLSMDGEPVGELTPADFPYLAFEAFSAKDNTVEDHVFSVEVEDLEGLTASAMAKLSVTLPMSGAQRCLFDKDQENPAVVMSAMSALVYTESAIIAVGVRDTGAGQKMAIWKLDPDHCEDTLPGWPKTIDDWTGDPKLGEQISEAKAVAVDEVGNIAIGGNLLVGGKPQRYTAMLTPNGGRVWERTGLVGEEVSSVVFADNIVIAGGWKFTSTNPPRTDAMIWRHLPDNKMYASDLKAPFNADESDKDFLNERSERIRAILIEPETGLLVVAGEREIREDGFLKVDTRAFIARFVPLGAPVPVGSPSTSPGDVFGNDSVYSIAVCGDELIAGGWTRDAVNPNATPQPLFRWASAGVWLEKKLPEFMPATTLRGATCDREGKVIGAGVRTMGGLDARVFAFDDPLGNRTWYEPGTSGDDEANGVACDARGFCAWPGHRTINGKSVAVVRVHHP